MTTTLPAPAPAPTPDRAPGGGFPAHAAVTRWAWRLFRREWRQQILLITLVAFTTAGAVLGLNAAHAYPERAASTVGSAQQKLTFDGSDPADLRLRLDAAGTRLGPVETIGHRDVSIPGSIRRLDVRAQDPRGRYGAPMLRLMSGRYPTGDAEIALTRSAADVFRTRPGSTVVLDGRSLSVVGLVENPQRLGDRFALAAPGATVAGLPAASVDLLADASAEAFAAYRASADGPQLRQDRGDLGRRGTTAAVFAIATVVLLLVSLVAAAGFAAIAQRRLRQIGMLSAIGAGTRHVRLVLISHGAFTGVAAALFGTLVGVLAWLPLAPTVEQAAEHRIDAFDLPWMSILLMACVAVGAPTVAAWWPARAMARIAPARALSARPPR
ncbi:FtsX-like permease family protein, partial [Streptomyces sp. SID3343]|uniref:ABC transporter permease n=1 Tax=Streptomyces sp. SID3343 TaxID=2690260 RepID=UPI00136830FB